MSAPACLFPAPLRKTWVFWGLLTTNKSSYGHVLATGPEWRERPGSSVSYRCSCNCYVRPRHESCLYTSRARYRHGYKWLTRVASAVLSPAPMCNLEPACSWLLLLWFVICEPHTLLRRCHVEDKCYRVTDTSCKLILQAVTCSTRAMPRAWVFGGPGPRPVAVDGYDGYDRYAYKSTKAPATRTTSACLHQSPTPSSPSINMVRSKLVVSSLALAGLACAQCPFADPARLAARTDGVTSRDHVAEYDVDDSEGYLTSDVGGPIEDQDSLKAGERGPTLLEDFIFRQKITHFDHERVCHPVPYYYS